MPRFGPPRGGTDGSPGPRPRGLQLVAVPEHARDRVPSYWPAARLTRARPRRTPRALVAECAPRLAPPAPRPTVWLPLDGPTAAERARRLQAAYAASTRDTGQRELIEEIMGHFRAWCEAHALGDPFVNG
jgi:hypothetical protein